MISTLFEAVKKTKSLIVKKNNFFCDTPEKT